MSMIDDLSFFQQVAARFNLELQWDWFDFASADYYLAHGKMMPDDWFDTLKGYDAIYFGAVGWPDVVPDHISLWDSLLQFRREFDQYVNLRPCRLMPGVKSPLADRKPGDIDFWVVRENTTTTTTASTAWCSTRGYSMASHWSRAEIGRASCRERV